MKIIWEGREYSDFFIWKKIPHNMDSEFICFVEVYGFENNKDVVHLTDIGIFNDYWRNDAWFKNIRSAVGNYAVSKGIIIQNKCIIKRSKFSVGPRFFEV